MERILIVDDEKKLLRSLEDFFSTQGYEVLCAARGDEAVRIAMEKAPDLLILDIMLPDISGYDVCRQVKAKLPSARVIMLSAKGEEMDKVLGLELGADDYMTKPFGVRELLARVRTLTRRGESKPDEIARYVIGDATIDLKGFQVVRGGKATPLTAMEAKIIRYLIAHRNDVVTREKLLDEIWGYDVYPTTRTVDNLILKLRKKIEKNHNTPRVLLTVYGAGYKFTG
ncbi:MAG: response regulator transcription factor [Candidatus Aureabacteria bacterium]|jgi:two-component system alkaline phosphatase synthesis response regulator PhoP|nr:response regulator transcription factor [Candidatus Auribacterota bacterium]HOE26602.1 response regulator transcription factor [bacterium]HQM52163.1 response regulator transcription factor [bacterium]